MVRSTQDMWNQPVGQSALSQRIISPRGRRGGSGWWGGRRERPPFPRRQPHRNSSPGRCTAPPRRRRCRPPLPAQRRERTALRQRRQTRRQRSGAATLKPRGAAQHRCGRHRPRGATPASTARQPHPGGLQPLLTCQRVHDSGEYGRMGETAWTSQPPHRLPPAEIDALVSGGVAALEVPPLRTLGSSALLVQRCSKRVLRGCRTLPRYLLTAGPRLSGVSR